MSGAPHLQHLPKMGAIEDRGPRDAPRRGTPRFPAGSPSSQPRVQGGERRGKEGRGSRTLLGGTCLSSGAVPGHRRAGSPPGEPGLSPRKVRPSPRGTRAPALRLLPWLPPRGPRLPQFPLPPLTCSRPRRLSRGAPSSAHSSSSLEGSDKCCDAASAMAARRPLRVPRSGCLGRSAARRPLGTRRAAWGSGALRAPSAGRGWRQGLEGRGPSRGGAWRAPADPAGRQSLGAGLAWMGRFWAGPGVAGPAPGMGT